MDALEKRFKTCIGCSQCFSAEQITSDRCAVCHQKFLERRTEIMAKADERALSTAARQILTGIANAGKGEARSPAFIEGAMRRLGGPDRFGEICGEEMNKARGCVPETGEPLPAHAQATQSPLLTLKWGELLSRAMARNDERESVEIGSLNDEDLVSTLRLLAVDLVESNEEFRRLIVTEALRKQPDLIDQAFNAAGKPVVDGEAKEVPTPPPAIDLSEIGIADQEDDGE